MHDFFLYHFLRYGARPATIYYLACQAFRKQYDEKTIKRWLRTFFVRFFQQQFKRSCLPDGPKVGSVSLSPRGDWRMPSDASAALWLSEIDLRLECKIPPEIILPPLRLFPEGRKWCYSL